MIATFQISDEADDYGEFNVVEKFDIFLPKYIYENFSLRTALMRDVENKELKVLVYKTGEKLSGAIKYPTYNLYRTPKVRNNKFVQDPLVSESLNGHKSL